MARFSLARCPPGQRISRSWRPQPRLQPTRSRPEHRPPGTAGIRICRPFLRASIHMPLAANVEDHDAADSAQPADLGAVPATAPAAHPRREGRGRRRLDQRLIELVKIRGSMLNGCSFCLDLHTRNARKLGETERRIYLLGAWRETNLYTEQERAALALTDAMTLLPETQDVPDEVYAQAIGAAGQTRRKLR